MEIDFCKPGANQGVNYLLVLTILTKSWCWIIIYFVILSFSCQLRILVQSIGWSDELMICDAN